ncbi:hypothetical protein EMIT051CA3_90048 [Pseudomonas chlororaphis]
MAIWSDHSSKGRWLTFLSLLVKVKGDALHVKGLSSAQTMCHQYELSKIPGALIFAAKEHMQASYALVFDAACLRCFGI